MLTEFQKKWVEALRSGKYEQGKKELRNRNGGFCCLGVACDLINPNKWKDCFYDGKAFMPSENELETMGINWQFASDLAGMNDADAGINFNQIADYIEKNLGRVKPC